jgi:spore coat protein CotH
MPVNIKSPEFEDVSDAERDAFIATLTAEYNAMESAVMSLTGWRDHIDVASFIDFMIVNELTRNSELYWPKSTNMYKKQGGKWTFGPVWDFDWAYGYTENGQNHWLTPESLMFIGNTIDTRPGAKFFNKLFEDAGFRAEYKARWNAVKAHLSDIDYFVDTMGAKLAESDMHNKQVWGSQYTKNYEEQIESMRTWLRQRIVAFEANVAKY